MMKTVFIENDGIKFYCEVRGEGESLLLIHGGTGDAGFFLPAADILSKKYKVVTYDRRCCSRTAADQNADADVYASASDATVIVRELCGSKANVFGTSAGGVIALGLAQFFPQYFKTIMSHEAPSYDLLADKTDFELMMRVVYDTLPKKGMEEAMHEFFPVIIADPDPANQTDPRLQARMAANTPYFIKHELAPFIQYKFDYEKLKNNDVELILVAGSGSKKEKSSLYSSPLALAEKIDRKFLEIPGYHCFANEQAEQFALVLTSILDRLPVNDI